MGFRFSPSALAVLALLAALLAVEASAGVSPLPGVWAPNSSGFKRLLIYYGWLNTSNVESLNVDVLVVAGGPRVLPGGDDRAVVEEMLSRGVEVYAYLAYPDGTPLALGSSFRRIVVENSSG